MPRLTICILFIGLFSCNDKPRDTFADTSTAPATATQPANSTTGSSRADTSEVELLPVFCCDEPDTTNCEPVPNPDENGVYTIIAEHSAEPQGGIRNFISQVHNSIKCPKKALHSAFEGRVFVEFIVNIDGTLSDFKVVKGIEASIDTAAVKALKETQIKWKPGEVNGVAVKQRFVLPVMFGEK